MKKLTVFTPAFNRAYCIHQLYESLLRQTNQEFIWLIVDDGSSDNTKELIEKWINENKIEIKYIYQENQGMHGAHNTAYEHIITELNVCIDSDDYMTDNAVDLILKKWDSIEDKSNTSGIVGLDYDIKGRIIGSKFPENLEYSTLYDIYHKHNIKGDKKLVLRTDIVKKYPKYPIFKDERFVPLGTLYLMIDQDYKLACLNKPLCIVEYMADGSTMNIFKQYKRHPKGFRYARSIEMLYLKGFKNQFKTILHFISSTIYAKDFKFFTNNTKKISTLSLLPLGILFHIYVDLKTRKD
ncbi:glycosyltransferase family 2 protein [Arcobacter roscoffensis]|uniref:Glycosyltransferase family 2 protein n=1 Tax=Arcobacter roscoffensis TaxID=2961520 RepID=A0ABY5E0R0_9BACT|nr:glycosyltransferase family 2 protein [Arcobacter roscoffensis]UTJ05794.1 glycosyltransferase family 2 protein [Arcobacter roscoffensis]